MAAPPPEEGPPQGLRALLPRVVPPPPPSTPQLDGVAEHSQGLGGLDRIQACVSLASTPQTDGEPSLGAPQARQRTPPQQRRPAQHLHPHGHNSNSNNNSSNSNTNTNNSTINSSSNTNNNTINNNSNNNNSNNKSPNNLRAPKSSPTSSLSPSLSHASTSGVSSARAAMLRPKPLNTDATATHNEASFFSATSSLPPRFLVNRPPLRGGRGQGWSGTNLPEVLELPPTISSAPSSPLSGPAEPQTILRERERLFSRASAVCEVQRTFSCDFADTAEHLGPVDHDHLSSGFGNRAIASRVNKVGVDPMAVYVRLSNFAARRRGLQDRKVAPEAAPKVTPKGATTGSLHVLQTGEIDHDDDHDPDGPSHAVEIEPISPFFLPKRSSVESGGLGRTASRTSTPTCSHALCDGDMAGTMSAHTRNRSDVICEGDPPESEPAPDSEEIELIQTHLEEMNSAAAHLNICQNALHSCETERTETLEMWAARSAELTAAAGVHRIARARPYFVRKRRMDDARAAVEEASREYLEALQANAEEEEQSKLLQEHVAKLEDFQIVQKEFSESQQALGTSMVALVKPYFEAEQEFTSQLAYLTSELERLGAAVTKAKARYHGALRDLEELSERTHRKRGERQEQLTAAPKGSPRSRVLHAATASHLERKYSFDSEHSSSVLSMVSGYPT